MMDDAELVRLLRNMNEYEPLGHDGWKAADRIEALISERDALKAARVKVKPLVWEAYENHPHKLWRAFCDTLHVEWIIWIDCEDVDAEKKLCEKQREARILAALELTPDTSQIEAIRAALEAAAKCCVDTAKEALDDSYLTAWLSGLAYEIRALDPSAIAAKLKGDGDDRA